MKTKKFSEKVPVYFYGNIFYFILVIIIGFYRTSCKEKFFDIYMKKKHTGRKPSKTWRDSRKNFFNNKIHFVFFTRRRGEVLSEEILLKLQDILKKICEKMKCELISFEGKADYVHLLVSIHPTIVLPNV